MDAGSLDGGSGSFDGNRLGKTIIRGLAAQLEVKISYENKNGTTVTVKIPMLEARMMLD